MVLLAKAFLMDQGCQLLWMTLLAAALLMRIYIVDQCHHPEKKMRLGKMMNLVHPNSVLTPGWIPVFGGGSRTILASTPVKLWQKSNRRIVSEVNIQQA